MISTDKNALICDLAEIYRVYDYRSLPAQMVATFSVGLRDDSRIKMKMSGAKATQEILILSMIADRLGILTWMFSEDGRKGINRPPQLIEMLYGKEIKQAKSDVLTFDTPDAFEKARQKILKREEVK